MIIDGKKIAEEKLQEISLKSMSLRICFISFFHNTASEKFMSIKSKIATSLGIESEILRPGTTSTAEAIEYIKDIEKDYDGIVVQLPLIQGMDSELILNAIPTSKDIDALNFESRRLFSEGKTQRMPPVVWAIVEIFKAGKVDLNLKKIVLLGKGRLVGMPLAQYFDLNSISYKQLDINTPKIQTQTLLKEADIIISGIGVAHFIKPEMIKENTVLIDAGTSELDGKIAGDFDPKCAQKAEIFTPVPGGVGPLTVAGLFKNFLTN